MAMRIRPTARTLTFGFARTSADLALIVGTLGVTALTVLFNGPLLLRVPLALVLIFIIPGYTLAIVLFPAGESLIQTEAHSPRQEDNITRLDRGVLSIGLSLSLVVILGLLLNMSLAPLAPESFLAGLIASTLAFMPFAIYRRHNVPATRRYTLFSGPISSNGRNRSGNFQVLQIILAVSIVFAGGAIAYSAGVSGGGDDVTEFYFLSESTTEELEKDNYTTDLRTGAPGAISFAIGNKEGKSVNYTVVGQIEELQREDGTIEVENRDQVFQDEITVAAGRTEVRNTTVAPPAGSEYRLTYLLYKGDPPAQPRMENAYREIHLMINGESAS